MNDKTYPAPEVMAPDSRFVLPRRVLGRIERHARSEYPFECCGVLVGSETADILDAVAVTNIETDRARTRFTMAPMDFRRIEILAESKEQRIVGIYHSHPDHPPEPSETDRSLAWPDYVYLVLSLDSMRFCGMAAWTLEGTGRTIVPLTIEITG